MSSTRKGKIYSPPRCGLSPASASDPDDVAGLYFWVLPMATSTGAGSGSQHAVGTGVMGGMISATILAIFFVPLFFVLVRRRFPQKERPQ
jgi:hypothetical protein